MHLWIIKDILFPRFCANCHREGSFLCADCRALLDISYTPHCPCHCSRRTFRCPECQTKIKFVLSVFSTKNHVGRKLLDKYNNGVRDIAPLLADLLIDHLLLLDKKVDLFAFCFKPIPEDSKVIADRGYSCNEELSKELNLRFQSSENKTAWVDLIYDQERMEVYAQADDIGITIAR